MCLENPKFKMSMDEMILAPISSDIIIPVELRTTFDSLKIGKFRRK